MQEHHLTVTRTARYYTLGDPTGEPRQVWFVCHGYGQLARSFVSFFAVLDDGYNYVVAPEALSRFYLEGERLYHGPAAKVGATWMTREDRVREIADQVHYLDALYGKVFDRVDRSKVSVRILGFSQGVATVCRWIERAGAKADHLILWAGFVPGDIDLAKSGNPFAALRLSLVVGDRDELAKPGRVVKEEARLHSYQLRYDLIKFAGGHHLNKNVLSKLARMAV
ncbi:MAG: phospholipase [Candidatus Krumholzibacteria bacterium]|nr:phospholipase [Candidatus Krumholzibacteria bacterium]